MKPAVTVAAHISSACHHANGVIHHIENRAAFALISPDEPDVLARFAAGRGWRFPVVSAHSSTFTADLGFEPEPGKCWPGASGLRREPDGTIVRVASATFGPGDDFCDGGPGRGKSQTCESGPRR